MNFVRGGQNIVPAGGNAGAGGGVFRGILNTIGSTRRAMLNHTLARETAEFKSNLKKGEQEHAAELKNKNLEFKNNEDLRVYATKGLLAPRLLTHQSDVLLERHPQDMVYPEEHPQAGQRHPLAGQYVHGELAEKAAKVGFTQDTHGIQVNPYAEQKNIETRQSFEREMADRSAPTNSDETSNPTPKGPVFRARNGGGAARGPKPGTGRSTNEFNNGTI